MLSDNGQHQAAIERGKEWLTRYPKTLLKADIGVILVERTSMHWQGAPRKSLEDSIPREHVHRSLAKIALIEGRYQESIELLEVENKSFQTQH